MKEPSPELSRLKRAAERDVCMQLPFQTPLILQSSQPDHGRYISTGKWLVPGNEEEGREQEVIHLGSRDSPGKESQPWPGLSISAISSTASSSHPWQEAGSVYPEPHWCFSSVLCALPGHAESWNRTEAMTHTWQSGWPPHLRWICEPLLCQTSRPLQPATSLSLPVNYFFFSS